MADAAEDRARREAELAGAGDHAALAAAATALAAADARLAAAEERWLALAEELG
jgi:hypothetical protein